MRLRFGRAAAGAPKKDVGSGGDVPGAWDGLTLATRIADLAPIGLLVVDDKLRARWMNRAILAINGLSVDDVDTVSLPELLPDVPPRAWETIRQVFATGQPVLDLELTGTTPATKPEQRIWQVSHYPIKDSRGTTVAVGVTVLDVTDQRRAEAARDAVERRLRLLSRASGLVGASLDLTATLAGMVELVVPEFADNCELFLVDEPIEAEAKPAQLRLRRVVGASAPGLPAPPADVPPGTVMDVTQRHPAYQAFATREPVLFDSGELLDRTLHPELVEYLAYVTAAARQSIVVPLLAGQNYHGTLFLGLGASGRTYSEPDVQTAAELGNRIASAVANACAYARQYTAALTLQQGLLPGDLPPAEGLELAWRYEPGGYPRSARTPDPRGPAARTEVGGDWFDAVPLSAGRVALVIGDVMGRGLAAAAVMGQLRTGVRAFAALDLPAADVLTHLDALVQAIDGGPDGAVVSCVYAIFEPATATITLANAGHLPPALVDPDGNVHLLDDDGGGGGGGGGVILGVTNQTFTETRYPFPPGATLVLYTDGLVESPAIAIDQGIQRLRAALAEPASSHQATADRLLTLIDRGDGYDDDVTLLLARATTPAAVHTHVLPPDPRSAKAARDAVAAALRHWQLADQVYLAELLVSELVTNAIRYAKTPSHLTLRRGERALYVEVADEDSRVPRLLNPTADDEGGRGLQLVAELATSWGARPTRTGKTVWFQLDLAGSP